MIYRTPTETALGEYLVHSFLGSRDNPRILQYFSDIGQDWALHDEIAWCAAFLNWVLLKSGKKGTGSLSARSFMNYGTPTSTPVVGDIVVLWRDNPSGPFGHVGLYVSQDALNIYILGGNQDDQVSIKGFPKGRLLGYRKIA